jgi:hypothetical protein
VTSHCRNNEWLSASLQNHLHNRFYDLIYSGNASASYCNGDCRARGEAFFQHRDLTVHRFHNISALRSVESLSDSV